MMGMEMRCQFIFYISSGPGPPPHILGSAGFPYPLLPSATLKFSEASHSLAKIRLRVRDLGGHAHHPLRQELSLGPGYGS